MKKLIRILTRAFWALLSVGLSCGLIVALLLTFLETQLPNVKTLKDVHLQVPLRVYTADRKLIAQFGVKRRIPITLDQVPKPLIQGLLATEDARFYEHPGIDPVGLVRAAVAVVTTGRKVQGASTITMQVARNFFLTRKKTYSRKIKEILLALKISREFPKEKVLELYLNKVYFGNRAYGIAAASQVYYGKTLDQLTLPEMAMLAGLPQAPSKNNPLDNPPAAMARRNHVLNRMFTQNYIDKKTYEAAIKAPLTASYHDLKIEVSAPYVAEMVRQAMVDEYGKQAYEMGLAVYTTINSHLQRAANAALINGLVIYDQRHGYRQPQQNLGAYDEEKWLAELSAKSTIGILQPAAVVSVNDVAITALLGDGDTITINQNGWLWARRQLDSGYVGPVPKSATWLVKLGDLIYVVHKKSFWQLSQLPQVQGALVALDPHNGAIVALSGGLDYSLSHFNRAVQAERQPGSNFKPFIYSAALDKNYTLATLINDAPIVQQDSGENELWRPTNDTDKFYGPTPLRIGLIQSRNLVSIRLLQQIGIPYALTYVQHFGFDPNVLPHTLSLALGTGLVTPLQIATGYAVFANGGYYVEPYFMQEVDGQQNKILFSAQPNVACQPCLTNSNLPTTAMPTPMAPRVLNPQNAYLMTHVMKGVIQYGTGRAAKVLNRSDLAGKTGTTNKQADAWFSGFNSNIVTTVWVGFDNLQSLHEYGAQAALPIWIRFMRQALHDQPLATMPEPDDIVTARIDPKTGLLARPDQQDAIFEVFRAQNAPHRYSAGGGNSSATTPASSKAAANDGGNDNDTTNDNTAAENLF